jgi:hypothetical protein
MLKPVVNIRNFVWDKFVFWLTYEKKRDGLSLSDFDRLRYELRPGDVLLVEGRSKVSDIIKMGSHSIWTHSFLYLGRFHDVDDPESRLQLKKFYPGKADDQVIIESLLGQGTIVDTLEKYRGEHLRICRPRGLTRTDAQIVVNYAIRQLGKDYNVRQLLDLARFMFPYGLLPKRWRSSLFELNAGRPTKTICSTMMAEAFASVHFPIRPVLHKSDGGKLKLFRRNSKLVTPPDFDYSPYFDVIKYPLLDFDEMAVYRKLPWDRNGVHCNDTADCLVNDASVIQSVNPTAELNDAPGDVDRDTDQDTTQSNDQLIDSESSKQQA